MKRLLFLAIAASALLVASTAQAQINTTVVPTIGPDSFTSPNNTGYYQNAINALSGLSIFANSPAPAAAYTGPVGTISSNSVLATPYNSWMGVAPPSGAYAGEFGNNLYFGGQMVSAQPGVQQFLVTSVSFSATSNNADGGLLVAPITGPITFTDFGVTSSGAVVGVIYNGPGTGDDVYITTSGNAGTLVDAIFFSGPSTSYFDGSPSGPTDQDSINSALATINGFGPVSVTGTFSTSTAFGGAPGSATADVVPEPASYAVMAIGMVGLFGYVYRRRQTVSAVSC
jgi:hypothetical protein